MEEIKNIYIYIYIYVIVNQSVSNFGSNFTSCIGMGKPTMAQKSDSTIDRILIS